MGLGKEWMADHAFEYDFPFGLPGSTWTTKDRRKIKLTDMTDQHILNCMKLVGRNDGWYETFEVELERRGR
jgi:hypothetical protein